MKRSPIAVTLLAVSLAFVACADRVTSPAARLVAGPSRAVVASPSTTFYLGDITLTGGFSAANAPQVWSIESCPLTLSATADLTGLSDAGGAHAWSELGVRQTGAGNFNPAGGSGVWLATDYDWTVGTFAPDPGLDLDDKLILQREQGHGEADYNLPGTSLNPGSNYRVWFDRDGVDQWQAADPLNIDGKTYNTAGLYNVALTMTGTSATTGEAYMTVNGLAQGFALYLGSVIPGGMTFTGNMNAMQVFYGLYGFGATHAVSFKDVTVTGCLVLSAGMATGGGWFIPEPANAHGITTDGSKATFGFNAKQKDGISSGDLKFEYRADGIDLVSLGYDWVTIAAGQAMFEGTGTINGEGSYKFRVRTVDGDKTGGADRFEIRVWTDGATFDSPTYRAEGDLGGGQVVVHK